MTIKSFKISMRKNEDLQKLNEIITPFLSQDQVRLIDLARERGASIWLSTLTISQKIFFCDLERRHNHLHSTTCHLFSDFCKTFASPVLHNLSGEHFASLSSSVSDEASGLM